jgi:hypothetical protein
MMKLWEDLEEHRKGCVRRARANYIAAYLLLFIAVVASAAASIATAAACHKPTTTAILAALPGIIVLLMSTFKFDSRADWWWSRHHSLSALQRGLTYENRAEADVSREWSETVKKYEASWPGFGRPPAGGGR